MNVKAALSGAQSNEKQKDPARAAGALAGCGEAEEG